MAARRWIAVAVAAAALAWPAHAEEEPRASVREVEIDAGGTRKLPATVYEPEGGSETRPVVVAFGPGGADRGVWEAFGRLLADLRVTVLAVDLTAGDKAPAEEGADGEAAAAEQSAVAPEHLAAALSYARESLLADGRHIGIAGIGTGAAFALEAARRDTAVRAVLCIDPEPEAPGLSVLQHLRKWDGRAVGILAAGRVLPPGAKKLERTLAKQPRTEVVLLESEKADGAAFVAADSRPLRHAAQWIFGWLARPELDGKPGVGNVKESSGPGHIVMSQSGVGLGMGGGGGLLVHGSRAPGKVEGVYVFVHPDPTSKALDERSRRLHLTPGRGQELSVNVTIARWTGRSWKKAGDLTLRDCGGFGSVANVHGFEIWLSPSVLGAEPFSDCPASAQFDDDERADGPQDPSDWSPWSLR